MAEKLVIVKGGKGRHAPKYALRGDIFKSLLRNGGPFSTRAEWQRLLNALYINRENSVIFRYYYSVSVRDAVVSLLPDAGDGGLSIGCNRFNRAELRKLARWVGWSPIRLSRYLPRMKKLKAQEAE